MSVSGRDMGPTLTEDTADLHVMVRVLGSSLNQGLCGYIVGGENTSTVEVEFDSGNRYKYQVGRLQLYKPKGEVIYMNGAPTKKRVPVVPKMFPTPPAQRPHAVVPDPNAERRREPREQVPEPPKSKKEDSPVFRKDAKWNF